MLPVIGSNLIPAADAQPFSEFLLCLKELVMLVSLLVPLVRLSHALLLAHIHFGSHRKRRRRCPHLRQQCDGQHLQSNVDFQPRFSGFARRSPPQCTGRVAGASASLWWLILTARKRAPGLASPRMAMEANKAMDFFSGHALLRSRDS